MYYHPLKNHDSSIIYTDHLYVVAPQHKNEYPISTDSIVMDPFIIFTTFFINCLVFPSVATGLANITTDQDALLALKSHIAQDPSNFFANNWLTTISVCNWTGVTCGVHHHRVTTLNISYLNLTGTIPPQLGNLSFLSVLAIRNNSFYGSLPDELAHLRRLKYINFAVNNFNVKIPPWLGFLPKLQLLLLNINNFVGTIPETLANISSLQELNLGENQLSGTIPSSIFNISSLKIILLRFNQLTGSFPPVISKLSSLDTIGFENNTLSGEVPTNICNCFPNLENLNLAKNMFEGKILPTLLDCKLLQKLSLAYNYFTGAIPKEIGNLTKIEILYFGSNNFQGEIPYEIGTLPHLQQLGLGTNNLVGQVPAIIFNKSTLTTLQLMSNKLSGSLPSNFHLPNLVRLLINEANFSGAIPSSIFNSSNLTILDVSSNSFLGFIPSTIGNLRNLQTLRLFNNHLTSSTPVLTFLSSLTNCKNLEALHLSGNPLSGILPSSIGNLSSSLKIFSAKNCKISGSIPSEIFDLKSLRGLTLMSNELTGSIPIGFGLLQNLQGISLAYNKLKGYIPNDLCHLHSLVEMELDGNELFGALPSCLGNLTSLRKLFFSSNQLTSSIPLSLWNLKDILYLNLSSNYLNGTLPLEIGNLKAVVDIDLSRNYLSGDVPTTIGGLKGLQSLSLGYNMLQGQIPKSVGEMVSLEFLDLSNNNISGTIPKSLEALVYLKYLNLSFNLLEGEIPIGGNFANFSVESFIGNHALCSSVKLQFLTCKISNHQKKGRNTLLLSIVLPLGIGLTMLVLGIILVLLRCKRRRKKVLGGSIMSPNVNWRRFSYLELAQATNGFSEKNLLGKGSFGSVYKGTVQDGIQVAIKVFNMQYERAFQSFDIEVGVLSNLRHRNLLKIISSCSNDDFKALVLEYMPNGSLEKCLYSDDIYLDMSQRLDIMIDVASALEYLHFGYSTPVVHCDLKLNNILLDENMVAHLSDFGISKLLGEDESMVQTQTLATIGYMAPEYGTEGKVSRKCDIYSYGIILMETFTKKKPTDEIFVGEMSLKLWVSDSLDRAVMKVADANLLKNEDEHFAAKEECVASILSLALECTRDSPQKRINIKETIGRLSKIRAKLLANTISFANGRQFK